MKTLKRLLFLGCLLLLSLCIFAGSAQAIEFGGLGIMPHPIDGQTRDWFIYTLRPGEEIKDRVDVISHSEEPIEVKIYPVDAEILKDGAFAPKPEDAERVDVGSWTRLTASEVTLPPNKMGTIDFTLFVPENAEPGKHTGAIIAQNKAPKELEAKEGTATLVITRVGVRIYVTVRGTSVQFLEIKDVELGEEVRLGAIIGNYEEQGITTKAGFDLYDSRGTLLESWVSSEEVLSPDKSRSVNFSKNTADIGMGDYLVVARSYRNGQEFKKAENQFRVGAAKFVVSGLTMTPQTVPVGEKVTISVSVENSGNIQGSYTVALKINGAKEADKSVTIATGGSQTVTFSITRNEAGSYTVDVDGLSGNFSVVAQAPSPAQAKPINWAILGGIIAAVVVVGLVVYFVARRRAY